MVFKPFYFELASSHDSIPTRLEKFSGIGAEFDAAGYAAAMNADTVYYCTKCRKPLPGGMNTPTFPFCSKKCRLLDLGHWLDGDYAISEPLSQMEVDAAEAEIDEI